MSNRMDEKNRVKADEDYELVCLCQKGEIDALVAQDPMRMGYEGVKTLVSHIQGKPTEKVLDTGVRLITKDNMNSPEIKKLLSTQK